MRIDNQAGDAEEVLDLVRTHGPDLVIADMIDPALVHELVSAQ